MGKAIIRIEVEEKNVERYGIKKREGTLKIMDKARGINYALRIYLYNEEILDMWKRLQGEYIKRK